MSTFFVFCNFPKPQTEATVAWRRGDHYFSYFLRDNSGLSFFSGEAFSAVGFISLLCVVPELRFLGGILVSGYVTANN